VPASVARKHPLIIEINRNKFLDIDPERYYYVKYKKKKDFRTAK